MDNRYEIAEQNGMSREFADWFFDNKKAGCGNVWFMMMAAMWEGWQGRAAMLQGSQPVSNRDELPYDPQIAAYEKIMEQAIPDGYALVPIDATRAMIDAAARVEEDGYDAMHKAMIAAAPQQEQSNA